MDMESCFFKGQTDWFKPVVYFMVKKLSERFVDMIFFKGQTEWFKPVVYFMVKKLTERFVDMESWF